MRLYKIENAAMLYDFSLPSAASIRGGHCIIPWSVHCPPENLSLVALTFHT